jgi:DNA repair protein RecO (recombination protein O)
MAVHHQTQGICLRRVDYGETSQVATLLTPDAGLLPFMARGAKRATKKGVKRGFDLLCRYRLTYKESRRGSLHTLLDRELVEDFRGLRSSLERILHGYAAAELMLNFTVEAQPCRELYAEFRDTLRALARGRDARTTLLLLEMAALRYDGTLPWFEACVECDADVTEQQRVLFSALEGGPLCRRCGRGGKDRPGTLVVSGAHLGIAQRLASRPGLDPDRLKLTRRQLNGLVRLIRHHVRFLLGKSLRTWPYLKSSTMRRLVRRAKAAE